MKIKLPAVPESKKALLLDMKDRALFVGWIAGAVLIGALAWSLSRPLLSSYLMRQVNQSLTIAGESIRLTAAQSIPPFKQAPLGMWYSVRGSDDLFFVFTVFNNGILSVFGAQVTPGNTVSGIIPVSAHARQIYRRLSPGILAIYSRRIENSAAQWRKNE